MNKSDLLNLPFWKRYYYGYLFDLIDFWVPNDTNNFFISNINKHKSDINISSTNLDYVVISDVLGYAEDINNVLDDSFRSLKDDGRIVITQYNSLWEPVLRAASFLGLRRGKIEQNWISLNDLKNFSALSGFDVLKSGSKMIMPVYIPLLSTFLNKFVSNLWPFSKLGLFHYVIAKKNGYVLHKKEKPSFSIIVPARNEAGTIEKIVRELPELGSFTEIIFIEGNSTDNTFDEIKRVYDLYKDKKNIKFAKQTGKGKGDAVRLGFDMAEGDILSIFDADMTVPSSEVCKFYFAIIEGRADFINGSRLVYPMKKESMRVLNFFGNKFFSFAFSTILGQQIKDTLCGTKVLWRKDYERIKKGRKFFGDFDPFGDFDLLFGAAKLNLKIIDLPVHYQARTYGSTNISRFRHGMILLRMTLFASRKIKFI